MAYTVQVRFKPIPGSASVKWIKNDNQAVIRTQALSMAQSGRGNQLGIAVIHFCRNIDGVTGIQHPDFGWFRCWCTVSRANLVKLGYGFG